MSHLSWGSVGERGGEGKGGRSAAGQGVAGGFSHEGTKARRHEVKKARRALLAAARDAVKREALRRAGVGYVEVVPGDTPTKLRLAA